MKKVFLSLAALAFVATGAVSCSSDDGGNGGENPGQNDDTPGEGDDTPGTEGNVFNWNGTDYTVDTTIMGNIGTQQEGSSLFELDLDQDGTTDVLATQWVIGAFNGPVGGYGDATNIVETSIYVPVAGEGENLTLVYPQEAEEIYLANTVVLTDGAVVAPTESDQITEFSLMINFVDDESEDNKTIDYETSTSFTSGTVSVDFNGALDGYYYFTPQSGTSVSSTSSNARVIGKASLGEKVQGRKLNVNNIVRLK